jgi:hypothetical protein
VRGSHRVTVRFIRAQVSRVRWLRRRSAVPVPGDLGAEFVDRLEVPGHRVVGLVPSHVAFARRIWAAGGIAELHVWPGGFHAFDYMARQSALSRNSSASAIVGFTVCSSGARG